MSRIVCYCQSVSEETILGAVANGANTLKKVQEQTGAGKGDDCKTLNPTGKCCIPEINKLLNVKPTKLGCSCCS